MILCLIAYVDDGIGYGYLLTVLSLIESWIYELRIILNDIEFS